MGKTLMSSSLDPYWVLGVPEDADIGLISQCYRRLSTWFDPTRTYSPEATGGIRLHGNPDAEKYDRVQEAFEVLSDEYERRQYDEVVRILRLQEDDSESRSAGDDDGDDDNDEDGDDNDALGFRRRSTVCAVVEDAFIDVAKAHSSLSDIYEQIHKFTGAPGMDEMAEPLVGITRAITRTN